MGGVDGGGCVYVLFSFCLFLFLLLFLFLFLFCFVLFCFVLFLFLFLFFFFNSCNSTALWSDIVILEESANDLQNVVDMVYESSSNLGLKTNIAKNEVQVIGKKENQIKISINGTNSKQVENCIFLGGTISQKGSCTEDMKSRTGKALEAIQKLQPIRKAEDIQQDTRAEVYRVLVLSIPLDRTKNWTLKKEDENRLLFFEMTCQRKIMGVSKLETQRFASYLALTTPSLTESLKKKKKKKKAFFF